MLHLCDLNQPDFFKGKIETCFITNLVYGDNINILCKINHTSVAKASLFFSPPDNALL